MVISLLPEKEKKELEIEKIWKKIFVILIFLLIFLFVFILILFPLKTYIASETESLKNLVSEEQETLKELKFENFQETTKNTNQELSKIQNFWQKQLLIAPIFEKISSLVPSSIYFTNFSFKKIFREAGEKDEKKLEILAEIQIFGWAKNREDLFYFKKTLEEEENFKELSFSPSSWVKPIDINFSLTFEFNPNDFE